MIADRVIFLMAGKRHQSAISFLQFLKSWIIGMWDFPPGRLGPHSDDSVS
jgi:hypothetical protein